MSRHVEISTSVDLMTEEPSIKGRTLNSPSINAALRLAALIKQESVALAAPFPEKRS